MSAAEATMTVAGANLLELVLDTFVFLFCAAFAGRATCANIPALFWGRTLSRTPIRVALTGHRRRQYTICNMYN